MQGFNLKVQKLSETKDTVDYLGEHDRGNIAITFTRKKKDGTVFPSELVVQIIDPVRAIGS